MVVITYKHSFSVITSILSTNRYMVMSFYDLLVFHLLINFRPNIMRSNKRSNVKKLTKDGIETILFDLLIIKIFTKNIFRVYVLILFNLIFHGNFLIFHELV